MIDHEKMEAEEVEYIDDIEKILFYGVMSSPALVINEKLVMLGNRGARRIEQVLLLD